MMSISGIGGAGLLKENELFDWGKCEIIRYSGNNCIVLKYPEKRGGYESVIASIDGSDIGITKEDSDEFACQRACIIFKSLITAINYTKGESYRIGYERAKRDIRDLIGV